MSGTGGFQTQVYDQPAAFIAGNRVSQNPIFSYDADADALYYQLTSEPVARTVCIGDRVNVDVDAAGEAVGIEVRDPPGFSASVADGRPSYAEVVGAIREAGAHG